MSTFGKLSAAVISGTNENTLALASINLDFSLVKLEAPKVPSVLVYVQGNSSNMIRSSSA